MNKRYSLLEFLLPAETIEDKEFGRFVVRTNARARRLIFRPKKDAIYITVPPGTTGRQVKNAIESLRHKLRVARQKFPQRKPIDPDFRIDAPFFALSLEIGRQHDQFLVHSEPGRMKIICPPTADFGDEKLQEWLRKVIEKALRRNAEIILPPRLRMLSDRHGLPFHSVKVNSNNRKWGSCSSNKDIKLPCFLLLLPEHLIDYVLLHELCHTLEMNHSNRFWDLLNSHTNHKAFELRNELKDYRTDY